MGPFERSYSYSAPYVHTWPGQVKTAKRGAKHNKARTAAFKAKHA